MKETTEIIWLQRIKIHNVKITSIYERQHTYLIIQINARVYENESSFACYNLR